MAMLTILWTVTWLGSLPAGGDEPRRFHIAPSASLVWFDADARLSRFRGETQQVTGSFFLSPGPPPQIAEAQVSIDAASLTTGNVDRDADMRHDFLEVTKYPNIEFIITDLLTPRPTGDSAQWDMVLQGRLTVHGMTREVQVPTTATLGEDHLSARGQVHLDMRDYNIRVPRLFLIPMQSEVLVGFQIIAYPAP